MCTHHSKLHKRQTEEWISARKTEIDSQRSAIAAEKAQLAKDQAALSEGQAQLVADNEALDAKVAAFEESRRQMEAIMNRLKGLQ